jgi:hypothetical protein
MVLIISLINKKIEFSADEVRRYSGIKNIPFDDDDDDIDKYKVNFDKLKSNILNIFKNYSLGQIKFDNKKIYNHIKFYKHIGIELDIKLESISKSKYKTKIYYKNTLIHICYKSIEVYFNYLVLLNLTKYPEFSYLFYDDNEFFNDNLITIDYSQVRSNERFDMKIEFNNICKSFGLECFEKHHNNKHDIDYNCERIRLLSKINYEKDIRFVGIFWYNDIVDKNIFYHKFKKYIVDNFNLHNKIKKDYCVNQLNICIDSKELCESIYNSYKGKSEPRIDITQINTLFCFMEGGKKKYLKNFKLKLKNMYIEDMKLNDKVNQNGGAKFDDLFGEQNNSESRSGSESESGSESGSEYDLETNLVEEQITEEEYLKKYLYENKLTFDGFGHYVQGLSFGNYLKFEKDKFRISEWYNKIMFALMKSFENAYDDLDNLAYSKNIFGLSDNETFDSETSDNN